MCAYCEEPTKNIEFHRQKSDSNITECFIHTASDGAALFLRQDFVLKLTNDCKPIITQTPDLVYANIRYCPMCGRKLKDETENSL